MSWLKRYQDRVTTAEAAVAPIQSGQRVFLTGNCSVPQKLLGALVDRAKSLEDVEIVQVLTVGPAPHADAAMEGHLRINTLFISSNVRQAVHEGRADFTPVLLSEVPILFKENHLALDAVLIQVSPPDEHGFCSLGIEAGLVKTPAQVAKVVIAEINEQMPRTLGDSVIPYKNIDFAYELDTPMIEHKSPEISDVCREIGQRVASLIEDGDCLQMGIGAIPDTALPVPGVVINRRVKLPGDIERSIG